MTGEYGGVLVVGGCAVFGVGVRGDGVRAGDRVIADDLAAMKARAAQAFSHYVAPLQILPGPDEPVHLARKLAADVLELVAALDRIETDSWDDRDWQLTVELQQRRAVAAEAERDEARRERDVYFQRWHEAETAAEAQVQQLKAAIEDYLLWEPGRKGHAAAHDLLRAALADVPDKEDA